MPVRGAPARGALGRCAAPHAGPLRESHMANPLLPSTTAAAILEKKQMLEEDLRRVEKQIYDLEGEYLQV